MGIVRQIPNILTLANMLCGCLGIMYIDPQAPYLSAYFVWAAAVFDFFDGYIARLVNGSSALGKQLDSLADMVSFGVLPAITVVSWLKAMPLPYAWIAYSGYTIALCTALRLAKFNVDEKQQNMFIGLPSPANALFITGLAFLPPPLNMWVFNPVVLPLITILFSGLLIAPMYLFKPTLSHLSWAENKIHLIFIAIAVVLLGMGQAAAVSSVIILYLLLSLFSKIQKRA